MLTSTGKLAQVEALRLMYDPHEPAPLQGEQLLRRSTIAPVRVIGSAYRENVWLFTAGWRSHRVACSSARVAAPTRA